MLNAPFRTISCLIDAPGLVVAEVSSGLGGARSRPVATITNFLGTPPEEARRNLPFRRGARVILIVPTAWCAVRPVPFAAENWRQARAGVLASIDQLVPVSPAEAMVAVVSRRPVGPNDDSETRGWILAARRPQVQAWIDHLARTLGNPPDAVVPAVAALHGLGLHAPSGVDVLDELAGALTVRHRVAAGEIESCAVPPGMGDTVSDSAISLTRAVGDFDPLRIAVAAAVGERAGAGLSVPLEGTPVPPRRAWLAPTAAAGLAILALLGARWVADARYDAGVRRLAAERDANKDALAEVERDRADTLRVTALLANQVNPAVAPWKPVLPALASAQHAVAGDGFLYWVRLDDAGVEMRGEAAKSAEVLRSLESPDSLFTQARLVDPVSPVPQRALESFSVRAARKTPTQPSAQPTAPEAKP